MTKRRGWIIGAATLAVALAVLAVAFAAGWTVHRPHNVGIAFDNTKGVVSGTLFLDSGPRPSTPVAGKVAVANVRQLGPFPFIATAPDGTFSITVAPGVYQVTGATSQDHGGSRTCVMPSRVKVGAGDHVSVNVHCLTGWP